MDMTVQTGQTKAIGGAKLIAQPLKSELNEQVIVLLQLQASPQEVKTLEKEALEIISNALLETDGDAATRLDGTLKELNGLFKGLLLSAKMSDIHAILAIVDQNRQLHVSHAGRAEAYVIRAGSASQITEYTRGKPTPAFVHIASGPLESRDILVFSTQRLLRTFTPAQLAQHAQSSEEVLTDIRHGLESDKEAAALATIHLGGAAPKRPAAPIKAKGQRRKRQPTSAKTMLSGLLSSAQERVKRVSSSTLPKAALSKVQSAGGSFFTDLKDPNRKRRAHLLLLAGILVIFLGLWATVNLSTYSQRSKTRAELEQLIGEIESDIQTAENRFLTGEVDSANAILQRAEERAKQVMDNENKLFRTQAHDLLGRIRTKREEVNNIVRLSPRTVVNLSAKNPDITAIGFIGVGDGEFVVFDHQDLYRIVLNSIDNPDRLSDSSELILSGSPFPRYKTLVFQTNGNSVLELISGQPTSMKTEDPAGWITGQDIEAYLRYLYVLSAENNQIYKYERYSNRYSAPAEYNVNGDLSGAIDMTIDGNVYVLKEGGTVVKLFRGEQRPFVIRHLPGSILDTATTIYKNPESSTLYLLDPENRRVIVTTDGGATGEATYLRQYVLEGEEISNLKDLYIDPEETRLYVLDEKRVYAIDLGNK